MDESEFLYIYRPYFILKLESTTTTKVILFIFMRVLHSFLCLSATFLWHFCSKSNLFHVSCCGLYDGDEVFASSFSFPLRLFQFSIQFFLVFFLLLLSLLDFRRAYNIYLFRFYFYVIRVFDYNSPFLTIAYARETLYPFLVLVSVNCTVCPLNSNGETIPTVFSNIQRVKRQQ